MLMPKKMMWEQNLAIGEAARRRKQRTTMTTESMEEGESRVRVEKKKRESHYRKKNNAKIAQLDIKINKQDSQIKTNPQGWIAFSFLLVFDVLR